MPSCEYGLILGYKVVLQDVAAQDAREYASFLFQRSKNSNVAVRWLDELTALLDGLSEMPKRYKVIEEQESFKVELRQVMHHSHRLVYHVNERTQTVHVLRVYHGARKPLLPTDFSSPID